MTVPDIRSVSDAKSHLSEMVSDVRKTHNRVILTVRGEQAAVLVSPEELASMEETIYWLQQPGILQDIEQSRKDEQEDHLYGEDEVRRILGIPKR